MIILGLTGSIGMGKSTVSKMFADRGVPIWDADAQVHQYYLTDDMMEFCQHTFPTAVNEGGEIDRRAIGDIVFRDPNAMALLKHKIGYHLEVSAAKFIARERYRIPCPPVVVLDVPLLFEHPERTFLRWCDYAVVVHCPADIQTQRVLAREGMTQARLDRILLAQMPSDKKVANADILIDTAKTLESVRERVNKIVENVHDCQWVMSYGG